MTREGRSGLRRCASFGQPFPPQLLNPGADRLEIVSCSGP